MGTLSRLGLPGLVRAHGLNTLVETGTGHGHSLLAALQVPELVDIRSIEIDHETYHRNRVVFATEPRVRLYWGDSTDLLEEIAVELDALDRRVLWFLDAHFPGSGRLDPLPMTVAEQSPAMLVPIAGEVSVIREHRDLSGDVIVVDDLCLFEPGNYETDAAELRAALAFQGGLAWLDDLLKETHRCERILRDGGYLVALPTCSRL